MSTPYHDDQGGLLRAAGGGHFPLLALAVALVLARSPQPRARREGVRCLLRPSVRWHWRSAAGLGRACLLLTAAGLVLGGLTVLVVGMTCVFVPQDLAYLGLSRGELQALNPR